MHGLFHVLSTQRIYRPLELYISSVEIVGHALESSITILTLLVRVLLNLTIRLYPMVVWFEMVVNSEPFQT